MANTKLDKLDDKGASDLKKALADAFPTWDQFYMLIIEALGEEGRKRLITVSTKYVDLSPDTEVYESHYIIVINITRNLGKLGDLIEKALERTPDNPKLKQFYSKYVSRPLTDLAHPHQLDLDDIADLCIDTLVKRANSLNYGLVGFAIPIIDRFSRISELLHKKIPEKGVEASEGNEESLPLTRWRVKAINRASQNKNDPTDIVDKLAIKDQRRLLYSYNILVNIHIAESNALGLFSQIVAKFTEVFGSENKRVKFFVLVLFIYPDDETDPESPQLDKEVYESYGLIITPSPDMTKQHYIDWSNKLKESKEFELEPTIRDLIDDLDERVILEYITTDEKLIVEDIYPEITTFNTSLALEIESLRRSRKTERIYLE